MAKTSQKLRKVADRPDWEAEILLAEALKKPQAWILAHNDYRSTKKELTVFNQLMTRRLKGEPLAYVLGEQEFYGLPFKVNKHVLIPRPETELITQHVTHNTQQGDNLMIIDVGTGSGAIIISLAKNIKNPDTKFFATDISSKALAVANQNAKLNGVSKNITFIKGDLLKPILSNLKIKNYLQNYKIKNSKIIITANLPYLKTGLPGLTKAQKRALSFEPRQALIAGADGLKYYRQMATQINQLRAAYPRLNLTLYLEADPDQMAKLKKLFPAFKAKVIKDFCGRNRFLILN